jgi:hypothetical protein
VYDEKLGFNPASFYNPTTGGFDLIQEVVLCLEIQVLLWNEISVVELVVVLTIWSANKF